MSRKILILASWFPDAAAPMAGIFVREQADLLARRYEVAVLVPRYLGWRQRFRQRPGPRSRREAMAGVVVQRDWAFTPLPLLRGLALRAYLGAARRGLRSLLRDWGRPDLIHAHVVLPGGWAAAALGRDLGVPVVLTEHSSPFAMHLGSPAQRRRVAATLVAVERTLAVSPALAAQIAAFAPRARVEVLGNLVRAELFTPGSPPAGPGDLVRAELFTPGSPPAGPGNLVRAELLPSGLQPADESAGRPLRLLCVALLSPQKGVAHLLRAAQLLARRGAPPFELAIGGAGPERAALERLAAELGLAGRCRFLGLLDRAATRDWMRWCDLFVLPSLHETFGIVLGEAMACGKPVIATRCGGPEFVVPPAAGVLVEPADPDALAAAIVDLAGRRHSLDPALIRRGVVARFGEEAFLRNLSTVYEQIWAE